MADQQSDENLKVKVNNDVDEKNQNRFESADDKIEVEAVEQSNAFKASVVLEVMNEDIEKARAMEIWRQIDVDNNDFICFKEFKMACKNGLFTDLDMKIAKIKEIWDKIDTNGDDRISFDEFYNAFKLGWFEHYEKKRAREMFKKFDTDNDGEIDLKEFKAACKQGKLKSLQAISMWIKADVDNNGTLSFDEFYNLYRLQPWLFPINFYCNFIIPPRTKGGSHYISLSSALPFTMIIFSLVEIFVYYINGKMKTELSENNGESLNDFLMYDPYRRSEIYRFVTYMFAHASFMHLIMNIIAQLFLGIALECVHSWWRVSLIYLAGILSGSLGSSLSSPGNYLVGASGGVYALITAHVASIIMNYSESAKWCGDLQISVFFMFCITDVAITLDGSVSHMTHLLGALAGLCVGFGVVRNIKVLKWETALWYFALAVYFFFMLYGIMYHVTHPEHFPTLKPVNGTNCVVYQ